ncbi:luciferase family protein [Hymenobacter psoromatis]|uniref:luciferase domain-containing protein n=1 Tax=Hymenobacter psoromatis TaxID=1484116 RepID=UPI001CBD7360|nr:luciferase family protein [Hymenobacter psoromatis]
MTLAEKGPLAPVPTLGALLEPISQAVQGWPGIVAATHWDLFRVGEKVDGADFYVGDHELGHLHLDGEAHLATSPALGRALVSHGLARPLRWGGAAYRGWTEFSIRTAADAAHATWLFQLNYQRLQGRPEAELVAEIASRHPAQAAA